MWIMTSGSDPRCRYFVNAEELTSIGHMSGQAFLEAIRPDIIKGVAPEDTVLYGQGAKGDRPYFLLVFRDDEANRKLAAVLEAVRDALSKGAGMLDLEELGQAISKR